MSHGDQLAAPPPDFHIIGHTKSAPYAAIAHNAKPLYGIQFHPEVTHSPRGKEVISRFVRNICGCKPDWTMVHIYLFIYALARIGDMCTYNDAPVVVGRIRGEGNCSHPRNLR
jgi:GMP synthase (glutamine-hydrolysing)